MKTGDVIIPNLVRQAEEVFSQYPEHLLDIERAAKEAPFLVLRYRSILNSIAGALIHGNKTRFNKAAAAYKNIYNKFEQLGLYHQE